MKKKILTAIFVISVILSFSGMGTVFAYNNYIADSNPTASYESGTYDEKIDIVLTAPEGYDIYYTLNGTVPTVTANKYITAFSLGEDYKETDYVLKAVGYNNGKYTGVVKYQYKINLTNNLLMGKIPTFNSTNTVVGLIEGNGMATDNSQLLQTTDNIFGNFNGLYIDPNEWFNYDLGAEYSINQLILCVYHNWSSINNLKIQFSTSEDFSENLYKLIDSSGSTNTNYTAPNGSLGFKFEFAPLIVRYVRVTNTSNSAGSARVCEIQAFEGNQINGNINLALNRDVSYIEGGTLNFEGVDTSLMSGLSGVVDNQYYDNAYVGIKDAEGSPSYVQIDLGKTFKLGKLSVCSHTSWDWDTITWVLSTSSTFDTGLEVTITTKELEILTGKNRGADVNSFASYAQGFEARYVRVTSSRGVLTEVQIFPYVESIKEGDNVLKGKKPYFDSSNTTVGQIEGGLVTEDSQLLQTTDGIFGNWNGIYADSNHWIYYDLGKNYSLNRILFSAYHNWNPIYNLNLQISTSSDFSTEVTDIIKTGDGLPKETNYTTEGGSLCFNINFAPVSARYIRVRNTSNSGIGESRISEIQAFYGTTLSENVNLAYAKTVTAAEDTIVTYPGGTSWINDLSGLTDNIFRDNAYAALTDAENNPSYVQIDLQKAYEIGKLLICTHSSWDWGDVLWKLSETSDFAEGTYIEITAKTLVTMIGANNGGDSYAFESNASGYKARYIRATSLRGGVITEIQAFPKITPVQTLTNYILPVNEKNQNVINSTTESLVMAMLGNTVKLYDEINNEYTVNVVWQSNFVEGVEGTYTFIGTLSNLPENVLNLYDVKPIANITVLPETDYTAMNDKINEYSTLNQSKYTVNSWTTFNDKYQQAVTINGDNTKLQQEVDILLTELISVYNALISLKPIDDVIKQILLLTETNYTPVTWQNLQDKIVDCNLVLNNAAATANQIQSAADILTQAKNALVLKADKTLLNDKINQLKNTVLTNYKPSTRAGFEDALSDAQDLSANENSSQVQIDNALQTLVNANNALIMKADKTQLISIITQANELNKNSYTSASFDAVTIKLQTANTANANEEVDQSVVDTAKNELTAAITDLILRGDKTALQALIDGKLAAETYTTASYQEYNLAIIAGQTVKDNVDAVQADINIAVNNINNKITALVKRGNKTQLNEAIIAVKAIDLKGYTETSITALNQAVKDAETVNNYIDSSEEEVSAAKNNLQTAIDGLTKNKSCNSNSGTEGALYLSLIALVGFFVLKKH